MRYDLAQRLKARGLSTDKIAALAGLADDDSIETWLDRVEQTTKGAAPKLGITYKEQTMPLKGTSPTVAREGDALDAAIDAADLRVSEADQVYKAWRNQGLTPALRLVVRYKGAAARVGISDQVLAMAGGGAVARQKAAPSMTLAEQGVAQMQAVLGNDEVDALITALAALPTDQLRQIAAQLSRATTGGAGTLTSDQKPPSRTKATSSGGWAHLFDEGVKELNQ